MHTCSLCAPPYAVLLSVRRRQEKTRRFLSMLRHSQMYEVFVQERLKASSKGEPDAGLEGFADRLAR